MFIKKTATATFLSLAMLTAGAGNISAAPLSGLVRTAPPKPDQHISTRRTTIAPFSFASFCTANAADCDVQGSGKKVSLSPDKMSQLKNINSSINRAIKYTSDQDDNDAWEINVTQGDCEDYALTKRHRLLAAGWPSGALRIAVARLPNGIGHAVLVVTTDQGDYVLDNRTNEVKPWHRVNLKWLKIQSPDSPRKWLAI
jgi:predicted transglutaminase-like cysteine proteinase